MNAECASDSNDQAFLFVIRYHKVWNLLQMVPEKKLSITNLGQALLKI
jgi:hypothetical protein